MYSYKIEHAPVAFDTSLGTVFFIFRFLILGHLILGFCFSPSSLLLGLYRRKKLATLTGRAPKLCGRAL